MPHIPLEASYLIHLLSCTLRDLSVKPPPAQLDWHALYRLAVRHGVSNLVWHGAQKLQGDSKPPADILTMLHADARKGMAKETVQQVMAESILNAFDSNGIAYMPLKGILLKSIYPERDMRQMADVDILFKDEQTGRVNNIMAELGFQVDHFGGDLDVYLKKPYMKIEMHRRLVPESSPYYSYLAETWNRAVLKEGSEWRYQLPREDEWIYLLIHLTKHYANGGTGIRSVMDIWVYLRRYRSELDWDYIQAELERIRLEEFAHHIIRLGEIWFDNAESEDLYEEMTAFIIASGAYGTRRHGLMVSRLSLFFPSLVSMRIRYPILRRLPILLPFCWIARAANSLLFRSEYTMRMVREVASTTKHEADRMKRLHKRAGLMR